MDFFSFFYIHGEALYQFEKRILQKGRLYSNMLKNSKLSSFQIVIYIVFPFFFNIYPFFLLSSSFFLTSTICNKHLLNWYYT